MILTLRTLLPAAGLPGNGDSLKSCGRMAGQVEGWMEIGERARGWWRVCSTLLFHRLFLLIFQRAPLAARHCVTPIILHLGFFSHHRNWWLCTCFLIMWWCIMFNCSLYIFMQHCGVQNLANESLGINSLGVCRFLQYNTMFFCLCEGVESWTSNNDSDKGSVPTVKLPLCHSTIYTSCTLQPIR